MIIVIIIIIMNNEILIKREFLVLPELGALYRKKERLEHYNSNNKLIHGQCTSLSLIHI